MKIQSLVLWCVGYCLQPTLSFSQINTFQFGQIDSLQKVEKKNVIIYINTDWCKYCAAMKNTTLKNKAIIEKINTSFYFVDLNAEEQKAIYFNGKNFYFKPTGSNTGIHQLAVELAIINNIISYPTLCFLNASNEIIFQTTDYKNKHELEYLLNKLK